MNSSMTGFTKKIFNKIYKTISRSKVFSIVGSTDNYIKKLIKNSFVLSLFTSKDNFDEAYNEKIKIPVLNFKNKLSKVFNNGYALMRESTVNKGLKYFYDNLIDINISFYGIIFLILGFFMLLKGCIKQYNITYNLLSSLIVFMGIVLSFYKNTSKRQLLTKSCIYNKFFKKYILLNKKDVVVLKNTYAVVLGIVFGLLIYFFGIIPAMLSLIVTLYIYFVLNKFLFTVSLVIFMLPFLPTMVLVALSLSILCLVILKSIIENDNEFEKSSIMNFAILTYVVALILGSVFSYASLSSIKILLVYMTFILFYFVIIRAVKTAEQFINVIYSIVIASIPVSLYGIIQKFIGFEEQNVWHDEEMFENISGRVISFFENPNVFGEYLIWIVIISLAAFFITESKKMRTVFSSAFIASVISMIFTYSRGCWIGVIIALALYLFMTNKKTFWTFVLLGVISLFFLPDSIITRISSVGNMADSSTSYRVYIWKGTFDMLKSYWVTGIGLGSDAFNYVYPLYAYSAISTPHPHNLYLLIMTETGVVGAFTFLFVIFIYYKNMIKTFVQVKSKSLKNLSAAFIAAMTGYLIQGLFDNVWYNYRIYFLFWIFVALATSLYLKSKGDVVND